MRVLLITNYWYPWNSPGTMRWLQLGRYLDFDVLTSKKPRKGFKDETLPRGRGRRIYRHGSNVPAVVGGLYLSLHSVFSSGYDVYIFTSPPFTLSIGAWLLQKMGKKVVLDVRDNQDAKGNRWKLTAKLCDYFRGKVKNRTTSFQFLDEGAKRILSGYAREVDMDDRSYTYAWTFIPCYRQSYSLYNAGLHFGKIPDYRKRQKKGYGVSSFVNLLYLGFKGLPTDYLHPECVNQPIRSWEESANQMRKYMEVI